MLRLIRTTNTRTEYALPITKHLPLVDGKNPFFLSIAGYGTIKQKRAAHG